MPSLVRSERGALQDAFEETTSALAKIVKDRLFTSDGYKNMKEYANERWEVSVRHLQRLVACSAVLEVRLGARRAEFWLANRALNCLLSRQVGPKRVRNQAQMRNRVSRFERRGQQQPFGD